MAAEFDISREAAARRYAQLRGKQVAVLFGNERRFVYSVGSASFPKLSVARGDQMVLPAPANRGVIAEMEDTDTAFWIGQAKGSLLVETLFQTSSRTISLLWFTPETDGDEEYVEDSFDRFSRLNGRD
jgi:hypothetical protein